MTYKIEIKHSAEKELEKLPKHIAMPIIDRIKALAIDPRPNGCKKLPATDSTYRITAIKLREAVIPPWTGGIQCHGWQAF